MTDQLERPSAVRSTLRTAIAILALTGGVARADSLIGETFDGDRPAAVKPIGETTTAAIDDVGTIDSYRGKPGRAISVTIQPAAGKNAATAGVDVGPIDVAASSAELAARTLAFDLWIDARCPVRASIESLDRAGKTTGTLTHVFYPPVAKSYFRQSVDLSDMKPAGGTFDPKSTAVRVRVSVDGVDTPTTLRVDNLSYTTPSLFVAEKGSDQADGRSRKTAFATVQRAIDTAAPGDVIALLGGTYPNTGSGQLAVFDKAGTPAKWIVLRSYPGETAKLVNHTGWDVVKMVNGSAYVEVRDITAVGNRANVDLKDAAADGAIKEKDGKKYAGNPIYNGNGLIVQGKTDVAGETPPHHIRFINNTVNDHCGGGVSSMEADYITIQGNRVANNAQASHYACSGISVFHSWDFDTFTGHKNFVLDNVSSGNRTYVKWAAIGKISDGNGIIIDDNICYQKGPTGVPYNGRTIVANNVVFNNGGSGIHAFASRFVDIVNNTAYHNAQSPELTWSSIFAGGRCTDVRLTNNIVYARRGRPLDTSVPKSSKQIVWANNVLFGDGDNKGKTGGGLGTEAGGGEGAKAGVFADPKFVRAATTPADADFRVADGSPAFGAGAWSDVVPLTDLDGKLRPRDRAPDAGAYQR